MSALLQANGIYLGNLKSQSKFSRSLIFWKGISTAPVRNLKPLDGRPLASERSLFLGILKSQSKIFRSLIFWKVISTAPARNLKARAGRPLASEQNLFRNSTHAIKKIQLHGFLKEDFHGAHKEP